jgi:hypothetical protein
LIRSRRLDVRPIPEDPIHPLSRLLLFAYFLESGLLLLIAPWSAFWERNFFVETMPGVSIVMTNHFVRGAVSGIGAVCLGAAFAELAAMIGQRRVGTNADRGLGLR